MLNESRFWLAIAALIAGFFVSTADVARAADSAFTTKAPRAILMDAESGATLFQQNADQLAPPASMSKLMTLAVLFRALKSGRIKTTDEFTMSVNSWRLTCLPQVARWVLEQKEADVVVRAVGRVRPFTQPREVITFHAGAAGFT